MPKLPGKENQAYWRALAGWAKDNSDGCTGVKDIYIHACWEHDFHYRYAVTLFGEPITFNEANARFRQVIQGSSKLKWFSPISWIRFAGVKMFGKPIWDRHRERNLQPPPGFSGLLKK